MAKKPKVQYGSHAKKAALYSLIPGGGQLYNGQKFKAIVLFIIFVAFMAQIFGSGISVFQDFITLGTVPWEDHSLFILIEGSLELIVVGIFFLFYGINFYDALHVGQLYDEGREAEVHRTMSENLKTLANDGFPYLFTFPSYILMTFVIIFPVLVTILSAFTNYDFQHIPPAQLIDWVGLKNFTDIFSLATYRHTFNEIFIWTLIWTVCATTLQIALGILTAVIANQKNVKGKAFFRIIFLLPWAVPAFISILSFSNMFNDSLGAINTQVIPLLNHLPFVDISAIPWKTDPFWTKVALITIQSWLGFPYIFVMVTGVLQSISDDLYEAAYMDGATAFQQFRKITLPMILFATAPVMITQYTFNFNNFSIIYLFNGGGPGSIGWSAGSSDILISWIYKLVNGQSPQYAMGAAITLIVSFIVIGVSLITFKKTGAFSNEGMNY